MIVPAFGDSRQARKRLKKRVEEIEKTSSEDGVASLLRERYLRKLSPLERQLEAIPALASLRRLIEQGGHQILAYRFVLLAVVIGIASAIVTWTVTRMPTAALGVGLLGLWLPFVKISRDRYQTLSKFEEQLPDAIDVMRRALMAGHPFNATLRLVAEDMEDPVAREFAQTFADINYGSDVRRAMLGLLARVPSVTVMALVTAILVQKESGGNLAEILEQIAKVVRERFRFQRRVRTLSAEGRMSAWILALIPLFLVFAMMTSSPDYLPTLFEDPMGRRMVMFAIAWAAIGVFFIRRIIRIEV
ncbi:MAG: type II secretion system F family protein [Gammaproteobacteria bacterium]|nr:MAG: type II secretion system F family protein [Gammaproteobacteria bacterium]